jgi:hypothetical protein
MKVSKKVWITPEAAKRLFAEPRLEYGCRMPVSGLIFWVGMWA